MSVEYLMSICKEAQPKELAYQIGLAVHKGLSEDDVWVALEPILDHRIMADVISRMGSVRRRDAEEEAELALASHPLLDLSPRLQILVLRALLRKHLFDEDKAPMTAFVDRLRAFWNDDARYLDSYWRTIPGQWIHGDLALHDDQGYFYILGRSDDTLKIAGKRLGPAEVEEILLALKEVSEAAAIGVADPSKGQKLVVFVIASPDYKGEAAALELLIKDHVANRMGKPFRPSQVYIMKDLPKTRSQKVMRRLIRNIFMQEKLGDLSALNNPSAMEELQEVLKKSAP